MARTVVAETRLADGRALAITVADESDAVAMRDVIVDAFSHRQPISPAPAALDETAEHIAADMAGGFGVLALVDGEPAGAVVVSLSANPSIHGDCASSERRAGIHRVSVRPGFQRLGVASVMLGVVGDLLAARGVDEVRLVARAEFPEVVGWWRRHGFTECGRDGPNIELRHPVAVRVSAPSADDMRSLGARLANLLRAGDVVIAEGDLGAGKTTLAQGIGDGLKVTGPIVSPTFVLSRVHPSTVGGPTFVHVDAYRLGSFAELEDIDVETSLDRSVTYIEWGGGLAEGIADVRLGIDIRRSLDPADETRWVFFMPVGERWENARDQLVALAGESPLTKEMM